MRRGVGTTRVQTASWSSRQGKKRSRPGVGPEVIAGRSERRGRSMTRSSSGGGCGIASRGGAFLLSAVACTVFAATVSAGGMQEM